MARSRSSRSSSRRRRRGGNNNNGGNHNHNHNHNEQQQQQQQQQQPQGRRSVAANVRQRQRAVAEREASRLARPEQRRGIALKHADRKKSAVTSTPFGVHKSTSTSTSSSSSALLVVGEQPQEWCGPFSVARQLIAEREESKRRKEEEEEQTAMMSHHPLDAIMDQVNMEQKKKAHPSLNWKGEQLPVSTTPSSIYAKRQKRADLQKTQNSVPTLFQLCVDFVVSNFEHVESLGDVDNDVRVAISKELVSRNQLDAKAFDALVEPTMETLEIIDCSGIPQDVMAETFHKLDGLRYLLLTHAGRCFGPKAVSALLSTTAQLCCLSISGAYLLTDEDAAKLINQNASALQSLEFQACPLLSNKTFVQAIHESRNLMELSMQDLNLSEDALQLLATSSKEALQNIQSLKLKSMPNMTDAILTSMLEAAGDSLETLDVSHNYDLTDSCLSGIRQYNTRLRSLTLDGVKELTAAGLEAMFTYPLEGLPPPPKLKVLKLASCDHQAVTDEVIRLVTASSSPHQETSSVVKYAVKSGGGGLAQLDIQGSTLVTDELLEQLVETCAMTLTELNVSYCPLISDKGLGYLVSKAGRQLAKIHVWGCAQLSDEFFDGHCRANDRSLEIVGVWMKKSGERSLR